MKYEMTVCTQCGTQFKRTNARHLYCSGACRVSAHRDRHGYEQPIFTYPSIRAVEQIRDMDLDALYLINLYAICYLDGLQKQGETLPPPKTKMDMQRMLVQLRLAKENDEAMNEVVKVVAPLTELLQLVAKIKEDAP